MVKKSEIINRNGFSLVEAMVGLGLLGGVALIGLKQSDMMSKVARNASMKQKAVDLGGQIARLLMDKKACLATFEVVDGSDAGRFGAGDEIAALRGADDEVVYSSGQAYLNSTVKIKSMKIADSPSGENLDLRIEFEKMSSDSEMRSFSRRFPLMVSLDSASKINGCFSFEQSVENTIKDIISKKLCQDNQGRHDPIEKACYVRGFNASGLSCPPGKSLKEIAYDEETMVFTGTCGPTFSPASCPNGWVKKLRVDGSFECASIADYINEAPARPYNKNCGLAVSGRSIAFTCL